MKKISLKLVRENLSRDEMRAITGGSGGGYEGNWACGCNSGVNITGVPSCTQTNCDWACYNQGGWNGTCICAGYDC